MTSSYAARASVPSAPALGRRRGELLREQGGKIFLVERGGYRADRAVERSSDSHQRNKIRQEDTAFQVTDVTLPQPSAFCQDHLSQLPLFAQFAYAIPDQFAGAGTRLFHAATLLTIGANRYKFKPIRGRRTNMLKPAVINRIRSIFLHHEPRVTIADAAGLLGWSRAEMNRAIRDGEIEVVSTCSGKSIELRELAAYALQQWPLTAIEEALGRDAALILPPALRTRKLTVRLPQYQIGALQVLAGDGRESVDAMLTRMFEELTDVNQQRLARLIPGLAEARTWPEPAATDRALQVVD